jgi:hypothetical protein
MPPLPVIAGIHRVALSWRVGSSGPTAVNVMHFYNPAADPDGLFAALDLNVNTAMWTGVMSNTAVYEVSITPLNSDGATKIYVPAGTKWAGAATAGEYSPATAVVVTLRTDKRGRRNRGRIYLPFPAESVMLSGQYATTTTSATTAWNNFRTALKTATYPMHVASYGHSLHRIKNPGGGYTLTPVSWAPTSNEVTSSQVMGTFGTQRRRQSRLG